MSTKTRIVYEKRQQREWVGSLPEGHVALRNAVFAPLVMADQTVGSIGLT